MDRKATKYVLITYLPLEINTLLQQMPYDNYYYKKLKSFLNQRSKKILYSRR